MFTDIEFPVLYKYIENSYSIERADHYTVIHVLQKIKIISGILILLNHEKQILLNAKIFRF